MNIALIIAAVSAVLSGLAGFALAWQLQSATITQKDLDYANERLAVQTSIATALEANQRQIAQAQSRAAARGISNRAAAAGAGAAAERLRSATSATVAAASTTPAACPDATAALGAVFSQCAAELGALAEIADRHASDVQLMQDAWPK